MDITHVNSSSIAPTVVAAVNTPSGGSDIAVKNEATISTVENTNNKQNTGSTADTSQPSESELKKSTDIKFVLHTKTNTLMIQIEDVKNHKILKECPPHELLDMAARLQDLRDYIGAIVDKKV